MTRIGRKSPEPQGGLSDSDKSVWDSMAKTLTPLKSRATRPVPDPVPSLHPPHRVPPPTAGSAQSQLPRELTRTQPLALGRRDIRRLRTGRVAIEAELDLHGMRLAEAHSALKRFLTGAHGRGLRWVLVITGKGNPSGPGSGERGALRRNVPAWLNEPDLRPIVLTHRHAEAAHGGEGALYIQIRKRRTFRP